MLPLPVPEAPKLRAIGANREINWMGSPVGRTYRIERRVKGAKNWLVLADDVSDGMNKYDPARA